MCLIAAILPLWRAAPPPAPENEVVRLEQPALATNGGIRESEIDWTPARTELPLRLSDFESGGEYQCSETLESWRFLSSASCTDVAIGILEEIHEQQFELLEAGYMDLSGECWGCVFIGSEGESLSVMLIPERPFSSRSDANLLVVNVLHFKEVEGLA